MLYWSGFSLTVNESSEESPGTANDRASSPRSASDAGRPRFQVEMTGILPKERPTPAPITVLEKTLKESWGIWETESFDAPGGETATGTGTAVRPVSVTVATESGTDRAAESADGVTIVSSGRPAVAAVKEKMTSRSWFRISPYDAGYKTVSSISLLAS